MASYHHKRKHTQHEDIYEQEIVDDLAFAASFAIVTTPDAPKAAAAVDRQTPKPPGPEPTIDETDDDSDSSQSSTDEKPKNQGVMNVSNAGDNGDGDVSDSDDESDIDLSEQLAKMEDDGIDEKKHKNSRNVSIVAPTTHNEVDLYNCPVSEIEKRLNIDLDLRDENSDEENNTPIIFRPNSQSGIFNARVSRDRLRLAGHIKFHLLHERTIVVESDPEGGDRVGTAASTGYGDVNHNRRQNSKPLLLDEGAGLFLLIEINDKFWKKIIGNDDTTTPLTDNEVSIVPLGKILEVFGPVKKPLYTVRLKGFSKSKVKPSNEVKEETQKNDSSGTEEVLGDKNVDGAIQIKIESEDGSNGQQKTPSESGITQRLKEEEPQNTPSKFDVTHKIKGEENASHENDSVTAIKSEVRQDGKPKESETSRSTADVEEISHPPWKDPWSQRGLLTEWVKSSNNGLEVYCSTSQVRIVDTQAVVRNSGKGCDASNIYDEEVSEVKEMYFSDDEEERNAKRKSKKKSQPDYKVRSDNGGNIPTGKRTNFSRGRGRDRAPRHYPNSQQQIHNQQQVYGGIHYMPTGYNHPAGPLPYHQGQQQPYASHSQQPMHHPYAQPIQGFVPHTTMPQLPPNGQIPPPPPPANTTGVYYPSSVQPTSPMQAQPYYNPAVGPIPPAQAQAQAQPYYNAAVVPPHLVTSGHPPQYQQPQYQQAQNQHSYHQQYGQGGNGGSDTVYYNYSGS